MKYENRLAKEKSPYLLQHKNNPVDWFAWSREAFDKAKQEDKPVFLSIGYSTCHWCHVMEKESFEDEEIADMMNDAFINIKVDREERPDIDGIYMTVCQMLTGAGGWPLTIVMTPDKKPFFAGTYFPKEQRFGRMGMKELIPRIKNIWETKKEEVINSAEEISSGLQKSVTKQKGNELNEDILKEAFIQFKNSFDKERGGFGHAPKFPTPHNLVFLLRYWNKTNDEAALSMVEMTLKEMRLGGIYDHIGFGFHRYSTDRDWLVPHFEKMLYDQALLAMAYTETYQATKSELYKKTAEEILEYVLRDMTSPEGGFYSAEDADSEGEEGKFYLWTYDEIFKLLNKDDAELFVKIYNIEMDGNWIDPQHGGYTGTNIPHLKMSIPLIAEDLQVEEAELQNKLNKIRKKLFDIREERVHPYKDDKILTDWNGLMISALAKAAQVLNDKKYSDAAEKGVDFIYKNLVSEEGKLLHRFREGEAAIEGNLDDYAFLISALIDLYEATFKVNYLEKAIQLNDILFKHFYDKENGGFYFTSDKAENLIIRQKEIYDGAVPSGNSVAAMNLLRLGKITGNPGFENEVEKIGNVFSNNIVSHPSAFSFFLSALNFAFNESYEIVIAGRKKNKLTEEFLKEIHNSYLPNKIVLLNDPDENLTGISDFIKDKNMLEDKSTVYVCKNYNCKMPTNSLKKLQEIMK